MNRLTGDFKGVSMFATVEQALQYNRLRRYEDTGLTPDEVVELVEKYNQLVIDYDRLYYHMQDLDAEAQYQAYENGQ